MRWRGQRQSANVEDRRGGGGLFRRAGGSPFPAGGRIRLPGGARRAGGGSILLLVAVAVALWVFAGINPLQFVEMLSGGGGPSTVERTVPAGGAPPSGRADEAHAFVSVVLAETENTWNAIFAEAGADYVEPRLVLFTGATPTRCGPGSAAIGPFYCPNDQTIYLDLDFFDLMRQRFRSPGDFAQAYVIAHEVGHHVQKQTGVLDEFHANRARLGERESNRLSVRVELQADCYAGIWAHHAGRRGLLEEGDIAEALNAAHQIGDDMMQKRTQGTVVPDAFNHGSSEQRARWFRAGYDSGNPDACDTFSAAGP